jgi:hypothetical protein
MGKSRAIVMTAFVLGAAAGLVLWWIIWGPLLVWFSGYPEPWEIIDGTLVINDFFGAVGKVVSLFALPLLGAVTFAKTAVEGCDRRRDGYHAPKKMWRVPLGVAVALVVVGWLSDSAQDQLPAADEDAYIEVVSAEVTATEFWTKPVLLGAGYDACADLDRTDGDPQPVIDQLASTLDALGAYGPLRTAVAHDLMVVLNRAVLLCPHVRE